MSRSLLLLLCVVMSLFVGVMLIRREMIGEPLAPVEALSRFTEVRAALGPAPAWLEWDIDGQGMRRSAPAAGGPHPIRKLHVLAYKAEDQRLFRTAVPYWLLKPSWFVKLRAAALQFMLLDTGLDYDRLGLTTEDLEHHGPGLVLDAIRPGGNWLLVWTE